MQKLKFYLPIQIISQVKDKKIPKVEAKMYRKIADEANSSVKRTKKDPKIRLNK